MTITVFTSNQPRHLSLIRRLSTIAESVYAIQECSTVFPGMVKDFFNNSEIMQKYFKRVMDAEHEVFGEIDFLPSNVNQLAIKNGDLDKIKMETLGKALQSDVFIVFGSGFIKTPLIDFLIEKRAINIHMGVSPYYRGSSCNFWAAYDGHPELVGATIHLLDRGLDSGAILYHALPKPQEADPFVLGMKAVKAAHDSLVTRIKSGELSTYTGIPQDKSKEYRYTKNCDFTDEVAKEYMEKLYTSREVYEKLKSRNLAMLEKPYLG